MNRKPTLFLDFDGLKFDTLPIHVSYINSRYGIVTQPEDYINNPSLETIIKKYLPKDKHAFINREEVYVDMGENLNGSIEWHGSVEPMEGMCEVLPLLAEKYQLWTVTARQKSSLPVIEYLLKKHVPNCITGIHCVWEHIGNNQFSGVQKRDFILNFEGEKIAFIDDSPKEILEMQDVLPSYLYDPAAINDHFTEIKLRTRSWKHLGEILL